MQSYAVKLQRQEHYIWKAKSKVSLCACSFAGSLAVLSWNGTERSRRRETQLLHQTDMGALQFDSKIEGLTILVCLTLEQFLGRFLSGFYLSGNGREERFLSTKALHLDS